MRSSLSSLLPVSVVALCGWTAVVVCDFGIQPFDLSARQNVIKCTDSMLDSGIDCDWSNNNERSVGSSRLSEPYPPGFNLDWQVVSRRISPPVRVIYKEGNFKWTTTPEPLAESRMSELKWRHFWTRNPSTSRRPFKSKWLQKLLEKHRRRRMRHQTTTPKPAQPKPAQPMDEDDDGYIAYDIAGLTL